MFRGSADSHPHWVVSWKKAMFNTKYSDFRLIIPSIIFLMHLDSNGLKMYHYREFYWLGHLSESFQLILTSSKMTRFVLDVATFTKLYKIELGIKYRGRFLKKRLISRFSIEIGINYHFLISGMLISWKRAFQKVSLTPFVNAVNDGPWKIVSLMFENISLDNDKIRKSKDGKKWYLCV